MLPPALRLGRNDFSPTVRRGVRAGRDTVLVHARATAGDQECRVGFVVARSVGGAVVRNRVRRRLRGALIEHRGTLPRGLDVVVRALPRSAEAEYETLREDVLGALRTVDRRLGGTGP